MGVEWGGNDEDLSPLAIAVLVLLMAAGLVVLAITAAPGDRGIPEQRPTTTEVQP